jgi:signal transduction histidine kinase
MGKLFWKFFLFLWLSQLLTIAGVGLTIWLVESRTGHDEFEAHSPPSPAPFIGGDNQPPPPFPGTAWGNQPPPPPLLGTGEDNQPPPLPSLGTGRDNQPPPPPLLGMATPSPPPEESRDEREASVPRKAISPPLLPLFAGSLASLLFAALLARYFSRPIRILRQAFISVAKGGLETRIGQGMGRRTDELADLGTGFDSMADHLQRLVEGKQRLLHDVSHELRSPLARLQAAIDLMQQQPERTQEFLDRIEKESARIDNLIEELLTLARLDTGIPESQMLDVDLTEMIKMIAEDASFEAETKRCQVLTTLAENISLMGNPMLLHRAIENIVRNAVRHTPDGGRVLIQGAVNEENTWLTLDIMDQGDGVPENELKLIFEPFYRSPSADKFKGFGIGMAITRRVIDAHKGKVFADNLKQGGLCVTLLLPLEKR